MSTVVRVNCPACAAECIEQEVNCWKCGSLLRPLPPRPAGPAAENKAPEPDRTPRLWAAWRKSKSAAKPEPPKNPITFDGLFAERQQVEDEQASQVPQEPAPSPGTRTVTLMTGEVVEMPPDEAEAHALFGAPPAPAPNAPAASIGSTEIEKPKDEKPLLTLTFCRHCGYDNAEGAKECAKCKRPLDVVESLPELAPVPRQWGFDVLGGLWCVLGLAAIFSGWFLLRSDPGKTSWADYFWTGVVACAPGVLIFMRHVFCKVLFWVMTLGSIMVWSVIGTVWILGHLYVSDNGQIGLIWVAILSALSVISFFTVRFNDEFDYSF